MGSNISTPITKNIDILHNQLMQHAGADYDIATTTTLSYSQFISYITKVNDICANYKDKKNCILVFAVKKGTDASMFWKATVRIACVKLNTDCNVVETCRLLNIRQFLKVFRRISYECTGGAVGLASEGATATEPRSPVPPTVAASVVLGEAPLERESQRFMESAKLPKDAHSPTNLEECVICLERKPEVILPCCHAYCTPCIEQWWEYCQVPPDEICFLRNPLDPFEKSCPVCRESLSGSEDTWVISESPDQNDVSEEIRKSLISFATCSTHNETAGPSSPKKNLDGT